MQKTGQIERTVDREFADEEAKFKTCVPPIPSPPPDGTTDRDTASRKNARLSRKIAKVILMPCEVCKSVDLAYQETSIDIIACVCSDDCRPGPLSRNYPRVLWFC
jgi:hypothetical protein